MKGKIVMGFLNNLFGFSKSNNPVYDNNSTWNKLYDEATAIENEFNTFMQTHGITKDVYIFDAELVNKGKSAIESEKRRLDSIKGKILEYINLGGFAKNISNIDNIDEYLEKVKYLKDKGILFMQDDFINSSIEQIKSCVEYVEQQSAAKDITFDKANLNSLSGTEFEIICKQLVEKMGFVAEMTKTTGDGGIDIVAYNYQPLLSGKYIIQCKRYSGSVGEPIIRDLYGVVTSERANKGILMTTGTFTAPAIRFAEGKPLELIDHSKLDDLFNQYGLTNFSSDSEEYNFNDPVETAATNFDWDVFLLENKLDWEKFFSDHSEFDLESALYIDYEQFEYWKERLQDNPTNLTAYWKLIEIVYSHISMWNTRSGNIKRFLSSDEVLFLSDLLIFMIRPFLSANIGMNTSDETLRCITFYSHLAVANCQLWNGNLYGAVTNWNFVVENWIYDTCFPKDMVIYSLITCLNALDLFELADSYYTKHKSDIDICNAARNRVFENNEWLLKFNKSKYDCYSFWLETKEIHEINTVATIAFSDLIGEDFSPICDFGINSCLISEIPDFIVRDGTSLILQKWKEPVENGIVITDTENCHADREKILHDFSSESK